MTDETTRDDLPPGVDPAEAEIEYHPDAIEASRLIDELREAADAEDADRLAKLCGAPDPFPEPEPAGIVDAVRAALDRREPKSTAVDDLRRYKLAGLASLTRPVMVDAAAWDPEAHPWPKRVAWMEKTDGRRWPFLRRGDLGVLSGAGGAGKTWYALGLAMAAGESEDDRRPVKYGGLRVAGPRAVVVGYERGAGTAMLRRIRSVSDGRGVQVLTRPRPLVVEDADGVKRSGEWRSTWDAIRDASPAIVVIDPALAALDVERPDAARPVRYALSALNDAAEDVGAAVLVVHHSTKAARYDAQALASMHPDAVAAHALAGSREWHDTPGAALFMYSAPRGPNGALRRELLCTKVNDAPNLWSVRVEADTVEVRQSTRFRRWKAVELLDPADREALAATNDADAKPGNRR